MTLYFGNSEVRRCIAHPQSEEEAFKLINKFANERNYNIFYVRSWKKDNETTYDVGSHTEFFYLNDKTTDEEEFWNVEDWLRAKEELN